MDFGHVDLHASGTSLPPRRRSSSSRRLTPLLAPQVPLAGETEQSHGVICTHTDITDRKRLQEMEVSHERSRFEAAEAQRQKADEEKCAPAPSAACDRLARFTDAPVAVLLPQPADASRSS